MVKNPMVDSLGPRPPPAATPTEWALVANLLTIWQFNQLTAVSTLISMTSNLTLEASRTCKVEILFKKCCEHPKALKITKPENRREM
jgi:hypothetical protein